jgi:hypothetical protein
LLGKMDLRRIIPTDITVSAIVHLSLLALLCLFSEVHQFGSVTAEPIEVNIVAPQDIPEAPAPEKQPEPVPTPTPTPLPDFSQLDTKPAAPSPDQPAAKSQTAKQQQKQAAPITQPAAQPPPAAPPQPAAQPPQQAQSPQPAAAAYKQPEPDLTLKYQVLLGLPPDLSPTPPAAPAAPSAPQAPAKSDDNFDGAATQDADIASSVITAFRRHLRTCLKLPPSLTASDDVKVKLRVMMTQRGTLAADPILIEASASMKGPLLMQSAVKALQACQPYAMLPADRYGEWKVLDLSFTPHDFGGAS